MYITLNKFRNELSEIDYSFVEKENIDGAFAYKSGLVYINELVENILSNYTDQYFFEYSLLSSTINPSSSELYSFAAINSNKRTFVEKIERYVNSIIQYLYPSEKKGEDKINLLSKNWFHNPELFLFPSICLVEPYICKDTTRCSVDFLRTRNQVHYAEVNIGNGRSIYVHNMSYQRKLVEILKASGRISERNPNVDSLIKEYHLGVAKSKQFYDKFLREENETYWFVTFPLLSTKNSYLSEYYKSYYPEDYLGNVEHVPGIGHFFIYFRLKDNIDEKALEQSIQNLFVEINHYIGYISNNYTYATGLALLESAKKESLKSAIAAIMSRNMSHNLGSHCMHYTKSALENLSGRLYGHGPEIRGAARLISYIQGRMDFLATLVSGEEYPYGAVNFKSQIIDVLTVDEFSKRHYKASSTREKYKIIKQSQLQTILELLSCQLDGIIRERKERNNTELTRVVKATEDLVNQLESLKLDNADLRTTNFLLENLIKSERFYRESIYGVHSLSQNVTDKPFYLYVRYNGELFTGSEYNIIKEETVKAKLSELNIAMPGGLMSTHAFFNIVENLIRNSAKHRAADLTESALITTIDVRDEKTKGKHRLRFTIFDNKHNASIAYPIIIEQLKGLQILNSEDASINKKSKGFKEMLIAALWLKSNEGDEVFSELLNKIEREKDGAIKLSLIKEYAYEIVKVDNQGNDSERDDSNLGLRFYLPYFDTCATFKVNEVQGETISQGIVNTLREEQVKADIVVMDEREEIMQEAYKRFPRLYDEKTIIPPKEITIIEDEVIENKKANKVSFNETLMLYSIMKKRFGDDIIKYQVVFGESPKSITSPANIIYFQRHFNKSQDFSEALNFMYADSVSGGNFTVTLQDNYLRGQSPDGRSLTWKDKYFSYKIIESALTRITLIDERLSDDYNDLELKSKNLRVLNLNPETPDENEIWSGSSFKDEDDYTLFLSIHLGLIEKVTNNENNWFMNQYNEEFKNNNKNRPERATFFMELLRRKFGKGKEIFISVHSGRGNYSYDLENSLKEYPFINLSAIESVFSNSKYLLAQLFYNTIYIGKGEYNQKQS